MLGAPQWRAIIATGLLIAAVVLGAFAWSLQRRGLADARNIAFSTLVFSELFRSFAARSTTRVLWAIGVLTNGWLFAVVVLSALLQLLIHRVPVTQAALDIQHLPLADVVITLVLGLVPVTVLELLKLRRSSASHF